MNLAALVHRVVRESSRPYSVSPFFKLEMLALKTLFRIEVKSVSQEAAVTARSGGHDGRFASEDTGEKYVAKLAQFFPGAAPVRVPVQVTGGEVGGVSLTENTVIEFGTAQEVLFASSLPLEFADQLRLRNSDGSLEADVCVVALQYHNGRTAVAARFAHEVSNWIVKD